MATMYCIMTEPRQVIAFTLPLSYLAAALKLPLGLAPVTCGN